VDDLVTRSATGGGEPAAKPATVTGARANGRGGAREGLTYTPALDGIRAFAILAVMGLHASWRYHSLVLGGYLGVDAFFVLSGFLITTLLLREFGNAGRVSFRNFYARRGLRLLPLLFVMAAIGIYMNITMAPGNNGRPTRQGITAALFYYANWFHIGNAGLGFLASTWSLAIEEQFYLIWPLLLIGMIRLGWKHRTLFAVALGGAAASALWRLHLVLAHPAAPNFIDFYLRFTLRGNRKSLAVVENSIGDRVYFGSDTRADMILVGCALAIFLVWKGPQLSESVIRALRYGAFVAAAIAMTFILKVHYMPTNWMWQWGCVVFELSIVCIIAAVMTSPRAPMARFLSWRPFVWIGRRAYGLYLIHALVFSLTTRDVIDFGDFWTLMVQLAIVFPAAAFSFRFIETPALKFKDRFASARAA
jgi:peptidoglycan/LPS O-acetylase OafA/YrhL